MNYLPTMLTLLNAICGGVGIFLIITGHPFIAGFIIVFGAMLDFWDGKLARLFGVENNMGATADMIADMVTFATAPAVMIWFTGESPVIKSIAVLYWLLLIGRLIRFRLHPTSHGLFHGLPSPSAAILTVSASLIPFLTARPIFFYAGCVIIALLAISKIRFPAITHASLKLLPKTFYIALYGLHVLAFLFWQYEAIFSLFIIYIILGPILLGKFDAVQARLVREGDAPA